jgi:uncharacterized membrane protein
MILLEWFLLIVTFPFWLPILLLIAGFFILIFGVLLLGFLLVSLGLIVWVLKIFCGVYIGLLEARKEVFKEIGNGVSSMTWWRLGRLAFNKYRKHVKEMKEIQDNYIQRKKEAKKLAIDE